MSKAQQRRVEAARERVDEERKWIAEHGVNLSGYVARYGDDDDPNKYGDGGRAIYAADLAALQRAEDTLAKAEGRLP